MTFFAILCFGIFFNSMVLKWHIWKQFKKKKEYFNKRLDFQVHVLLNFT